MKTKCLLLLIMSLLLVPAKAVRIGMKFDDKGRFVNPDDYLVYTALEAEKGGYLNDAMWRFKDAAAFGNKHAQYYIGLMHMNQDDFVTGYAWLQLAGEGVANNDYLLPRVKFQLNPQQLIDSEQLLLELRQQYNFLNAIKKRADWKKRLRFGGTRIRGHIPHGYKTILANNVMVFGTEVRRELDQFVFDYRYDEGEVKLTDFELEELDL